MDEVVVKGQRSKKHLFSKDDPCSGVKCIYSGSGDENIVRIEPDGGLSSVHKVPFSGTRCGKPVIGQTMPPGAFTGAAAAAHDHPGSTTTRVPGPGDYAISSAYGIPNYVISANSVMVVEKAGGSPRVRVVENAPLSGDEKKEMQDQISGWMNGSCK